MMVSNLKVRTMTRFSPNYELMSIFQTRNIVLHGLEASPGPADHPTRFLQTGFLKAKALDMKTIRRGHLPRSELDRLVDS